MILAGEDEVGAAKSFRNIPRVAVLGTSAVGVADVIGHGSVLVSQAALEALEARVGEVGRGRGEDGS